MMACVTDNGAVSEAFTVTDGVKQGCVLAPTLFSLMLSVMLMDVCRDECPWVRIAYRTDGHPPNSKRISRSRPCHKPRVDCHPRQCRSHCQCPAATIRPAPDPAWTAAASTTTAASSRTPPTDAATSNFSSTSNITNALISSDVGWVHTCPHCGCTFDSHIGLVGRLRVHRTETGEPVPGAQTNTRFIRPHCIRTFTQRMNLLGHMRIHENLR
ncbi:hypothetical protein SprV_0802473900 [Sparganum proliferum]